MTKILIRATAQGAFLTTGFIAIVTIPQLICHLIGAPIYI